MKLIALIAGLLVAVLPEITLAADDGYTIMKGVVSTVGGILPDPPLATPLCGSGPGCQFVALVDVIMTNLRPAIAAMAILIITIFGFRMIVAQEDDALTKARTVITACITGVIISYLVGPFISAFYGVRGERVKSEAGAIAGSLIVNKELAGLINWALVIVAALAVTMIIVSGIKALVRSSSEEGIGGLRSTVISVGAGLLLIAFKETLSLAIGASTLTPSPVPILSDIVGLVSFVLTFGALAAVSVIVYAAILMIVSYGREEQVTKARSLIYRAVIGLAVILISWAIVTFVIDAVV